MIEIYHDLVFASNCADTKTMTEEKHICDTTRQKASVFLEGNKQACVFSGEICRYQFRRMSSEQTFRMIPLPL
jgi:heat shock protein HslJ